MTDQTDYGFSPAMVTYMVTAHEEILTEAVPIGIEGGRGPIDVFRVRRAEVLHFIDEEDDLTPGREDVRLFGSVAGEEDDTTMGSQAFHLTHPPKVELDCDETCPFCRAQAKAWRSLQRMAKAASGG
jgi:hypothetical protein